MYERLFFDVDGVLLNFEHAFVCWLNQRFGHDLPEDYEASSWYFEDVLSVDECKAAWHEFLAAPAAGRMKPLVEPQRFNALTRGRPVHLLTNFPEHLFESRIENLARLGFQYESIHYCGFHAFRSKGIARKSKTIAELLRGGERGFFVDDHPDNCTDVAENCPSVEVWLMSRRFNSGFGHPDIRRAQGWGCVIDRLNGGSSSAGAKS